MVFLLQKFSEDVAGREDQFELLRAEGGKEGRWAEYLVPEDMQNELPSDDSQPQSPGGSEGPEQLWFEISNTYREK